MYHKQKLLNALGLCKRAGKLVHGDELMGAIASSKVKLVILSNDASDRTKKQYRDKCSFYKTDLIEFVSREELSMAIGMHNRVAVGVEDRGFIKMIKNSRLNIEEVKNI